MSRKRTADAAGSEPGAVFAGGGEMGARMRALDWSATPLGAVERWPQSLKTALRILLTSRQPMFVWWGEQLINLYNDPYRAILGGKHPAALAQPANQLWQEIWHQIEPRVRQALSGHEGSYDESLLLITQRHGYPEETYSSFSYSPLPDSDGSVGGILCVHSDDTARIVGERQLQLLRELAVDTADVHGFAQTCELSLACLARSRRDFPFAAIYRVDGEQVRLMGAVGVGEAHPALPALAALDGGTPWPLAAALESKSIQHAAIPAELEGLPTGAWERPPHQAMVLPICGGGQNLLLVAGLNPYRLFDETYRDFAERIAGQIAGSLAKAQAHEEQRRRAEALAELDRVQALRSEAERMNEVALSLSSELNLDALMQKIVDAGTALSGARFGSFFYTVINERGQRQLLHKHAEAAGGPGGGIGLPRDTPIFEPTFRGEGVVRLADLRADPAYGRTLERQGLPLQLRSYLAVPVRSRAGTVLGGLFFGHPQTGRFDEHHERLLTGVAAQAAVAIDNARLYEQAKLTVDRSIRAEAAWRESEKRYRAIGESIDYGVWMCDASGSLAYVSDSLLRLLGTSLAQMQGLGWLLFLHPDEAPGLEKRWRQCVEQGEAQWDSEIRMRGIDGEWHPILTRGVALRDERGQIAGWTGINLDISRLKSVESELRDVDRRKNEFLAVLAHELRNPLAPIRNGLEVIKLAGSDPHRVAHIREMMERQLGHMVRLIDDLLDLSRVTQGKIELRRSRTDINAVLQNAIEASRPYIEQAGHTLTVTGPAGAVPIEADVTRLSQVFSNLLNNAAKYTKEGGRIWVTVTRLGAKVFVSVKDNGVGIPAHMLPHVFDMFTQVDRSLARSQSGLGIGLAISKRLVEMHGGIIEVRSDGYGKGSEFLVRLPAVPTLMEEALPVNDKKHTSAKAPRHRILVVDDNADSAASMAIICEVVGNEVRTACDGLQAIEVAEVFQPHVILMDIGMPRLDGYEACKRIREQSWGRDIVIVALTGWGQEEDRRRSQTAGFNRHLVKPVSFEAIKELLGELAREHAQVPPVG